MANNAFAADAKSRAAEKCRYGDRGETIDGI